MHLNLSIKDHLWHAPVNVRPSLSLSAFGGVCGYPEGGFGLLKLLAGYLQDDGDFQRIKSKGDKKKDKLLTMDPTEITYEMVNKKLREIALARGKKGVDRQEQARNPTPTSVPSSSDYKS